MDKYGFYTGKIFDAYEYLGCHLTGQGAVFRTFAPAAQRIALIGEFNGWTETEMHKIQDGHFWECEVDGAKAGMMYKYRIYKRDGSCMDHCDPYGFGMELRPQSASYIRDLAAYQFHDEAWMKSRTDRKDKPLNIYELHAGSWKTEEGAQNGWLNFRQLADRLIPYIREWGYHYIELLPVSEHPSDNSWGYQNTGFFSPTARYGTMDDFKYFVDQCHQNQIGVLLDFVLVHFALDAYGLADYDGTSLYEYPHTDVGDSEWGSKNFNHSRGEVCTFLQSNANYWIKEYHIDGLRMDAISNLIYWQGNPSRGVNSNAVNFLQYMNEGLKSMHPSIILAAEDSTSYPNVTKPVAQGGLGFDYKWDMGWMNDTLAYMKEDTACRKSDYHKLTFSMMYYYDENFLLPFSHDEVVHGKATILQKMNGDYDQKFPQARALYMYMYAHPGKKLNFMGNEIGQFREWDEKREQDWMLLEYPLHQAFHLFMKELNQAYGKYPAFWKLDYDRAGFRWLDCSQKGACIYAFVRSDGSQEIAAVFNFSCQEAEYTLCWEGVQECRLLLASDDARYGGTAQYDSKTHYSQAGGEAGLKIPMGAFCAKYLIASKEDEFVSTAYYT